MRTFKRKIYKNGATLVFKKTRLRHTAVVAGFIFGKNRDKYPEPTAHFCEHMFFKETESKNSNELSTAISETFPRNNGRTGLFFTEIDFCRSNKALEPCFKLASEMLLNTKFSKKHIESEKGVIKQELVRKLNNPDMIANFTFFRCTRSLYCQNTAVLGSEQEISNIDAKTLKKFRNDIFVSQNFTITIQGGISYQKAKRLAEKYFIKQLKSNPDFPVDKTTNIISDKQGNLLIENYPFKKSICKIGIKLEPEANTLKNRQIANMLCGICNSTTGILLKMLRDNGLVYGAGMWYKYTKEESMIGIDFSCSDDCVNKCIDKIGKIFNNLRTTLVDENIIETKKKNSKLASDEANKQIYPSTLFARYLSDGYECFTRKYKKQMKKLYYDITPQDILDFCNQVLTKPENLYVSILTGSEKDNFYTYEKMQKILFKANKKSSN